MKKLLGFITVVFALLLVGCEGTTHIHSYSVRNTSDEFLASSATCTSPASYFYSCDCGLKGSETFTSGEVLGHSYEEEWDYDEEYHWHECSRCGDKHNYVHHTFDTVEVIKEATDTEKGIRKYTCSTCGYTKTEEIAALSHTHEFTIKNIDSKFLASQADCVNPAKYYYACECGEKGTETYTVGNALGHSFTNYVSNSDATCTHDGTKTAKCDHCNETSTIVDSGSMLEHTFDKKVIDEKYLASNADCTHPATYYYSCSCGECGTETFEVGNALAHTFNKKVVDEKYLASAADCTHAAKYYYSCECGECGTDTFEVGTPLAHTFTNYVSNSDATCTHDGTKTAKCDHCDATNTIVDEGTKLNHIYNKKVIDSKYLVSDADCTHATRYYYSCECGECGTETFEVGIALGHTFTDYVSNHDATCTHDGTKTAKCDHCDVTQTIIDENSKLSHTFDKKVSSAEFLASAADCTHAATYYYSCECGECGTETFESGNALGHTFINYVSDDNATCTHDGTKTAKCDHCDATSTIVDEGTKLDHTYNMKVVDEKYLASAADCTHAARYYYSCICGEKGTETFEVGQPLGHSFTNYISNGDATCTSNGTKTAKCDHCDETDTVIDYESMLAHAFTCQVVDEEYLASEATCTHAARYYYSCDCGECGTETFTYGEPLEHSFTHYYSNNDATCTHDGTKTAKCDHCDATNTIEDEGSKLDHTFNQQVVNSKYLASVADCTHAATYYYSCICGECGTETFESGIALGHLFTNYVSDGNATCDHDGTKTAECDRCDATDTITDVGTKLDHTYSSEWSNDDDYHWHSATCEHSDEYTDKSIHNWIDVSVIREATEELEGQLLQKCSVCDKLRIVGITYSHTHTFSSEWTSDDDYHWHCATCEHNDLKQDQASHDWDSGVITQAATHTEEGIMTYTCETCGKTKEVAIAKLTGHTYGIWTYVNENVHKRVCSCGDEITGEHNWNDGVVTTAATHTHEGVKTYTCLDCGGTKTESIPCIEGHTYGLWNKYNSLCHVHECECGDKEYESHHWNNGVITTAPTHTTLGVMTYTCTDCGETKTEQIPTLEEHNYGVWVSYNATLHKHTCECGDVEYEAHNFDDGVVTTPATHTTYGVKTYTCETCGYTRTEIIEKLTNHTYGEWSQYSELKHKHECECGAVEFEDHTWDDGVRVEATHSTTGTITYTCTKCGEVKVEVIPVIEHEYSNWENFDETNHKYTCECGAVEYENHTWNDGEITTQSTHTTMGVKTYTCTVCGATKTEDLPCLEGHTYGDWVFDDSTYHRHTCECGEYEREEHNYIYDHETESTLTEHGYVYNKCTGCGNIIAVEEKPLKICAKFYDGENVLEQLTIEKGTTPVPSTPTKTGYRFDHWDKEITAIENDTNYYAVFVKVWTISYYFDGVLDKTELVDEGTIPSYDNPTKEGYRLDEWDREFVSCTEDASYYATFIKVWTVQLYSDGELFDTVIVDDGDATYYTFPTKEGYRFRDWDIDLTEVRSDLVANAIFGIFWYVDFVDYNGKLISSQIVDDGDDAVAPTDPTREATRLFDYEFNGWNNSYTNVQEDLEIKATYNQIRCYYVTVNYGYHDDNPNDEIDGSSYSVSIRVHEGTDFSDLTQLATIMNSNEFNITNYTFDKWDNIYTNISSNQVVNALYVRTYKVTFISTITNQTIKEINVTALTSFEDLTDSQKPSSSETTVSHYDFLGWDNEYENIQCDQLVYTIYQQHEFTVKFVDHNGNTVYTNTVHYGDTVTAQDYESTYFDETDKCVKTFIGWKENSIEVNDTFVTNYNSTTGKVIEGNYSINDTLSINKTDYGTEISIDLKVANTSLYLYAITLELSWTETDTSGNYDVDEYVDNNGNYLPIITTGISTDAWSQATNYSNRFHEIKYSGGSSTGYKLNQTNSIISITFKITNTDNNNNIDLSKFILNIDKLEILYSTSSNASDISNLPKLNPYIVKGGEIQ